MLRNHPPVSPIPQEPLIFRLIMDAGYPALHIPRHPGKMIAITRQSDFKSS
jgi:hypothetical protein